MRDQLDLFVVERTENHARIVLVPREGSGISQVSGVVRGPFSEFSKTLTADSQIKRGADGAFGALVVEPCYWTPRLPFWYDLRIKATLADGTTREEVIPFGIKRFYCERINFMLEGKRIVLRGLRIEEPTVEELEIARKAESALVVDLVTQDLLATADRLGVPLVVDLRERPSTTAQLEWHAAVLLVLVTSDQAESIELRNVHRAVCVGVTSDKPKVDCDAYAIELQPGERPPAWAATCDKPVIVIRKDPEADIRTARAGCDRLQAELAPEFDLAGYFV